MLSDGGRLGQPALVASRHGAPEPAGFQALRLLGDALAALAPRGADEARPPGSPSIAFDTVRHPLRAPSTQTRDFSVSDILRAARPEQSQGFFVFVFFFLPVFLEARGGAGTARVETSGARHSRRDRLNSGAERPRRERRFDLVFVFCFFFFLLKEMNRIRRRAGGEDLFGCFPLLLLFYVCLFVFSLGGGGRKVKTPGKKESN